MDQIPPTPESVFQNSGGTIVPLSGVKRPRADGTQDGAGSERGERAKARPGERVLSVLTPAECECGVTRSYVVKGLIARGDHAQFIGLPGSGKSTLAPLIAYSIALGLPVLGRRVKQGPVLYLAAEDGHGMKLRVRALRKRLGDTTQFLLVPEALNLLDPNSGDVDRVAALIRTHRPVAVFLDTVARAFPGLRENESDSMGRVVAVARGFADEDCRPAVITVHHVAKEAGITPRGHGVLVGDLDVVVLVQGEKAELRTVLLGKNRNGASDATFAFNIESEDFGEDEDGDLITAPIAAPIDGEVRTLKSAAEARLNDKAAILLRELRSLIDGEGEMVEPGKNYPPVRAVTRFALRSRLIERGWFSENLLCADEGGKSKLERGAYAVENNSLNALKRRALAGVTRDHAWLI